MGRAMFGRQGFGRRLLSVCVRPASLLALATAAVAFTLVLCIQTLSVLPANRCGLGRLPRSLDWQQQQQQSSAAQQQNTSNGRQLVLIGLMTAQKYVDTRAYNAWRTWAQTVPGEFYVFVAEGTQSAHQQMPIVSLPGVDDTYPPQKKSFVMLQTLADYGLDEFDWFIRADDDLFIRTDKLEALLRSLDPNVPLFMGQAGLGTSSEYGTLSLAENENYCMGGPGMVLSRAAMAQLHSHIGECLSQMYTTHEDVELGRCVKKFVGLSCTWSYEMQQIFHNNGSGANAFVGELNMQEIRPAATLHPVKQPDVMLRLDNVMRSLRAAELGQQALQLSRDLFSSWMHLKHKGKLSVSAAQFKQVSTVSKSPSMLKYVPDELDSVLHWDYFNANHILYCVRQVNCPRHNIASYWKTAHNQVIAQMFEYFNRNARQRGRLLSYQSTQYGYRRVNPLFGVDYVFDMILMFRKFKGRRATVPVRRHAYVQQPFGQPLLIDSASWCSQQAAVASGGSTASGGHCTHASDTVHFILPLAGRLPTFRRFVSNYESVCLAVGDACALNVVVFQSNYTSEYLAIKQLVGDLQHRYPSAHIQMTEMSTRESFSRGLALAEGSRTLRTPHDDPLLLLTDVDILFDTRALHRIRLNTVRSIQVFYPVVFSGMASSVQTSANTSSSQTHSTRDGYFRHFGFGIASMYRSDLQAVGGLNTDIRGWGLEDVDLFEKFIKLSQVRVLRAPEPALVHVFHAIQCDRATLPDAQYRMCLGSKAATYAAVPDLADAFLQARRRQRTAAALVDYDDERLLVRSAVAQEKQLVDAKYL